MKLFFPKGLQSPALRHGLRTRSVLAGEKGTPPSVCPVDSPPAQAPTMMAYDKKGLFLLNLDTWVTKESLAWLRETQAPVVIVNNDSAGKFHNDIYHPRGEPLLNIISDEEATAMVLASCYEDDAEPGLKLMTNGEAGYKWLRDRFGSNGSIGPPALRMLQACSDKRKFRTITRAAFPELKVMTFSAASSDDHMEAIITEMRQPGTFWITKPSAGFCAVGVEYWGSFEGAHGDANKQAKFSVDGLRAALEDVLPRAPVNQDDERDESNSFEGEEAGDGAESMLVEAYLQGRQYTADGYFDSAGEVEILQVSWAPKDPSTPGDIREVVLGTDLNILREQRPLAKTMMEKIQAAATTHAREDANGRVHKSTRPFFRNFPFMVEYRVDPSSGTALPIEVNSFRHEGKAPAYASFIFNDVPLYDFFFKEMKFSEDLLQEEIRSDLKVAAMVFARKPDLDFDAKQMDFPAWADAINQLADRETDKRESSRRATGDRKGKNWRSFRRSSQFENGKHNFFGWLRGHFEGWGGLLSVLEKDWEKNFVMTTCKQ